MIYSLANNYVYTYIVYVLPVSGGKKFNNIFYKVSCCILMSYKELTIKKMMKWQLVLIIDSNIWYTDITRFA